ncbi:MAG: metalloregulator ArsR/SmtB family transcription factor [Kiritimatiellaceae bacterium]|nr:metalloregulator ArsR/SmtB family transcription factor [Kiritimatiellaceae bacterium]
MQIERPPQAEIIRQAAVTKAIGHPSRLLIIHALMNHELCVCELRDLLEQDISTVSRHLSVLKNAGLLREEKRGLYVYYQLTCPCIIDFLTCVNRIVGETQESA